MQTWAVRGKILDNNHKTFSLDTLLLFILTIATIDLVPDNLLFWKDTHRWVNIILPFKPELIVSGDPLKPFYNLLKVSLLLVYLFADILSSNGKKASHVVKLIIISCMAFLTVIAPTVNYIAARHSAGPSSYAHDGGVIQTEEAVKFLLKGENPYSVTYEDTPVRDAVDAAFWERYGVKENPIIHHFPYPPMTFLFSLPFSKSSTAIFGWYDQRFLYLALFFLTMLLAYKIAVGVTSKLSIVIILSLNPIDIFGIKGGTNDILLLFWIVLMVFLLKSGKTVAASVVLALACGSKQMAWLTVPFFFTYLYGIKEGSGKKGIKRFLRSREMLCFAASTTVIFLPFLLWDGRAFIEDILSFHAGTTGHPYPLRGDVGYGFANLVLHFGLVNSPTDYFPFTLFQFIFTVPLFGWFLFRQVKGNSINRMLFNYTITLFVFLFFGRYMAANYVGFILSLLAVSHFMTVVDE